MSRAYCLTCNDQVEETAGGTCPLGHPVATPDHGPEPWVGFAGTGRAGVGTDELEDHDVPMARIDTFGRPVAHATVNGHNGHNGHEVPTNGHALGGGHGAADSQAADDLAALLADALGDQASSTGTPEPTEATPDPDEVLEQLERDFVDELQETTDPGGEWDDLASLAAELQLDADQGADDGPGPAVPESPDRDEPPSTSCPSTSCPSTRPRRRAPTTWTWTPCWPS